MKNKLMLSSVSAMMLLVSCSDVCKVTDSGVTVKVQQQVKDGPALVRLEVRGDKIIHVSATPERRFADSESLVILPSEENTPFEVLYSGDTVTVVTSEVRANVLKSTGEVWFAGPDGQVILREEIGGGKSFSPIEVEGTHGYSFRQAIQTPV